MIFRHGPYGPDSENISELLAFISVDLIEPLVELPTDGSSKLVAEKEKEMEEERRSRQKGS